MRILVFGAGVLGCNLARNLFRAGKDVTLLARGNWAEEIRKNGLWIKDKFSFRMSVSRIPVVTELKPEDRYDVIFVVLRYTQLGTILETLRENQTKNIVFVGNNVRAEALAADLPEKNVLFAFASSAGHRERDHVASVDLKKITIGQLASAPSNEALIGRIFEGTKYKVAYEPNILHLQEFVGDRPRRAHVHQPAQQDLLPLRLPRDLLPAAGRPLPQKRLY